MFWAARLLTSPSRFPLYFARRLPRKRRSGHRPIWLLRFTKNSAIVAAAFARARFNRCRKSFVDTAAVARQVANGFVDSFSRAALGLSHTSLPHTVDFVPDKANSISKIKKGKTFQFRPLRSLPDSNWSKWFCRPAPSHSAKRPFLCCKITIFSSNSNLLCKKTFLYLQLIVFQCIILPS